MLNTIKQYFCAHDYHNVDGYDVNGVYWVVEYRCKKCGKIKFEKLYYPPKCLITGKYCDNENTLDIDCRYCFRYRSLSLSERSRLYENSNI